MNACEREREGERIYRFLNKVYRFLFLLLFQKMEIAVIGKVPAAFAPIEAELIAKKCHINHKHVNSEYTIYVCVVFVCLFVCFTFFVTENLEIHKTLYKIFGHKKCNKQTPFTFISENIDCILVGDQPGEKVLEKCRELIESPDVKVVKLDIAPLDTFPQRFKQLTRMSLSWCPPASSPREPNRRNIITWEERQEARRTMNKIIRKKEKFNAKKRKVMFGGRMAVFKDIDEGKWFAKSLGFRNESKNVSSEYRFNNLFTLFFI